MWVLNKIDSEETKVKRLICLSLYFGRFTAAIFHCLMSLLASNFSCGDGSHVHMSLLCDHISDCINATDENCGKFVV